MKKNYIQPAIELASLESINIICSSPVAELNGGTEGADPNSTEIF